MMISALLIAASLSFAEADSADKLRGGRLLGADEVMAKSTVILIFKSGGDTSLCTGTLIAEDLILTAAHCLTGTVPLIHFGTNVLKGGNRVQATVAIYPRSYSSVVSATNRYDVGLVRFAGGLPQGFEVARFAPRGYEPRVGDRVTVVGGGSDRIGGNPKFGRLKTARFTVTRHYSQTELELRQKTFGAVCPGDSGGPAFTTDAKGELRLWGVANLVGGIRLPLIRPCGMMSVYANATSAALADWVEDGAREIRAIDCSAANADCGVPTRRQE